MAEVSAADVRLVREVPLPRHPDWGPGTCR